MFLRRQMGQPFLMTFPIRYLISKVQSMKINAVFSTKVILKIATKGGTVPTLVAISLPMFIAFDLFLSKRYLRLYL